MAEGRFRTLLAMPREDLRRQLQERVSQAKEIATGNICTSDAELINAEEREKRWCAYNRTLLSRAFTTDEYAREYGHSKILVRRISDRRISASTWTFGSRLIESVKKQVTSLESIIDRLELIDEPSPGDVSLMVGTENRSRVFVVHGHDEGALQAMARFLEAIGLQAIILREQPDRGRTTIEKFEACAAEVGFTVVLLTPDDLGGATAAPEQAARARQNVIFELGYFVGPWVVAGPAYSAKGMLKFHQTYSVWSTPTSIIPAKAGRSSSPEN
jgi:hypothetical protein